MNWALGCQNGLPRRRRYDAVDVAVDAVNAVGTEKPITTADKRSTRK